MNEIKAPFMELVTIVAGLVTILSIHRSIGRHTRRARYSVILTEVGYPHTSLLGDVLRTRQNHAEEVRTLKTLETKKMTFGLL